MRTVFIFFVACFFANSVAFAQRFAFSDSAKTKRNSLILELQQMNNANNLDPLLNEVLGGKITRIKVNPLLVISGDMPIYVEREIGKKTSVEISGGVTYDNIFSDLLEESKYEMNTTKEGKHGVSASAALRYYPAEGGDKLERYYFAPEVRFRHYTSTLVKCDDFQLNVPQSRNIADFKLVMGYLNYIGDNVFVDFYSGIGMRNKQYNNKLEGYTTVYDPETAQTVIKTDLRDATKNTIIFSLGFKLGFNF